MCVHRAAALLLSALGKRVEKESQEVVSKQPGVTPVKAVHE